MLKENHPHEYSEIESSSNMPLAQELNFSVSTHSGGQESLLGKYETEKFPKVLLISFMAEWCPNCHYEASMLNDIYGAWHNSGFDMTIVAEYSDLDAWENKFMRTHGINIPYFFGELNEKNETLRDNIAHTRIRKLMNDQRIWGVPLHILIVYGNLKEACFVTGEFIPGALEQFLKDYIS